MVLRDCLADLILVSEGFSSTTVCAVILSWVLRIHSVLRTHCLVRHANRAASGSRYGFSA